MTLGAHDNRDYVLDQNKIDVPVNRTVAKAGVDIAMVFLAHDVDFIPICLPLNQPLRSRRFENETPFVAGWIEFNDHSKGKKQTE